MSSEQITVRGARQNNLKALDLSIPLRKLVVVTGVSGSGKSSLAFDTIYSEGQRRYVETFSAYTRQFLDRMDKPNVDAIEGIPPAIAIDQTNPVRTSRSTVGTMTELNDHLKLVFARAATLYCRKCGRMVGPETAESVYRTLVQHFAGQRVPLALVFQVKIPHNFDEDEVRDLLKRQGYERILARHGAILEVIQDRVMFDAEQRSRIIEDVEACYEHGGGKVLVYQIDEKRNPLPPLRFSQGLHCATCDLSYREPIPNMFSFNSPIGACETCRGFGRVIGIDYDLVVPDPSKSLAEGAIRPWQTKSFKECQDDLMKSARKSDVRTDVPWSKLTDRERQWVIEGEGEWDDGYWYGTKRFFRWLEGRSYRMHVRVLLSKYRAYRECEDCHGARLKPEALLWRIDGRNIHEVMLMPIDELARFFDNIRLPGALDEATDLVLSEIRTRLRYLADVGLGYLTLDRQSRTLSGGEVQRINLTTALGTNLVNTLFVLDEPSIGLHPRDIRRLIGVLHRLRDAGNTLIVVEHDPDVIHAADIVIDMGPGPGERGGEIVFQGTLRQLMRSRKSLTAEYLTGRKLVSAEPEAHRPGDVSIGVRGAREHNLKNFDVSFPLRGLVTVTGVSGSGKSTLIQDILYNGLSKLKKRPVETAGDHDGIDGHELVTDVVLVDQSPIGRTTRSNPASYVGAFDAIRKIFAAQPVSLDRTYTIGTFSFNSGNGRCPLCGGNGFEHIEMQFLSDVYIRCPECDGTRYRPEILEVKLKAGDSPPKSIAEVLEMTVNEACDFFADYADVLRGLEPLRAVGLGYLRLGQPVTTLSGGEAQRLKLAGHLAAAGVRGKAAARRAARSGYAGGDDSEGGGDATGQHAGDGAGGILFLFDEPTTGLHFEDIATLLGAFRALIASGHSLIVIEHNIDVMAGSDWIIDLGPEGGDAGGELVAEGTPREIASVEKSHTGKVLAEYFRLRDTQSAPGDDTAPDDLVAAEARPAFRTGGSGSNLYDANGHGSGAHRSNGRGTGDHGNDGGGADASAAQGHVDRADAIVIRRAREHNLKNVDLTIPRDKFTVITGVSGSGKSTVAFDILFAEGQRRYLESLNAYARQFVQPASRPDVDGVHGVPPTVAIEQRTSRGGRKSTVATVTEVYHFLRLLFVKLGTQYCPDCNLPIEPQTEEAIHAEITRAWRNRRVRVLAPMVVARKGYYTDLAKWARTKGYRELRVDGEMIPTEKWPRLDRYREHWIEIPVLELTVGPAAHRELASAIADATGLGKGSLVVAEVTDSGRGRTFSVQRACPNCGRSFEELDPRLFSFNTRHGWCPECFGTGILMKGFDAEQTGEEIWWNEWWEGTTETCPACEGRRLRPEALAVRYRDKGIVDFVSLSVDEARETFAGMKFGGREAAIAKDIVAELVSRLSFLSEVGLSYLTLDRAAPTLSGGEAQRIRLAAQLGSNLRGVCYVLDEPTIGLHSRDNKMLLDTLYRLKDKGNTVVVVEHDEDTIRRAEHVIDLGPGGGVNGGHLVAEGTIAAISRAGGSVTGRYLKSPIRHPLDNATTDPGRGARPDPDQVSESEPSAEDTKELRVVGAHLHNLKNIDAAIPLGRMVTVTGVSGSGKSTLVRHVIYENLKAALSRTRKRSTNRAGRTERGDRAKTGDRAKSGDRANRRAATDSRDRGSRHRSATAESFHGCKSIEGLEEIRRIIEVDQTPIGKTPRSCPATYVGIWDHIRKLYAALPESRMHGYTAARFSFNVAGGRCEDCGGQGVKKIEMSFLPDVSVTCDTCLGKRFDTETLSIHLKGKSVADVLAMSVDEAVPFFSAHPAIHHTLSLLQDVGLGYITLGQQSPTLSGGEAQRIKLVTELSRTKTGAAAAATRSASARAAQGHTLYVLDEPTIGLHTADVERLVRVLKRLVAAGNTIVIIEHNLDVIAESDWMIDLGPEGGEGGGRIVAAGRPIDVAASGPPNGKSGRRRNSARTEKSYTGDYLQGVFAR